MPEYVAKLRAAVRVGRPGEEPIEGIVSLAPQVQFRDGPETILELLNSGERIIPFERRPDGVMLMLNRAELEWVMAGPAVDPDWIRPRTYLVTREERVRVRFRDGGGIDGVVRMELPEDLNRVSDFLNQPDDYFPLMTAEGTYLINKSALLETRLFALSPMPVGSDEPEDDAA